MIFNKKKREVKFKLLIRPHLFHLNQLAVRLTGNSHDAEDLIQDVLIKVYPHYERLNEKSGLKTWLSKVTYHTYIDLWRKKRTDPIHIVGEISTIEEDDVFRFNNYICHLDCPELLTRLNQQQQVMTRLLYQLTNEHRIVIIMHDVEGYTLPELHEILNVALGTLKSRLHRARGKLKIMLAEENICSSEIVA